MTLKAIGLLLKDAASEWWDDKAPRLGAALAFYTALSLSPLLLILVAITGLAYGEESARAALVTQAREAVGPDGAKVIELMVAHAPSRSGSVVAALVGFATLLFSATGLLIELQDALNTVWEAPPRPGGVWSAVKDRLLSFAVICLLGLLLVASLVLNAVLAGLGDALHAYWPGWVTPARAVTTLVSFAVTLVLFAVIYKLLPDVRLAWRDVWVGAAVTAVLFTAGKFLIALYLGRGAVTSSFGAAGSLVLLLLWVYYSAQVLFFGAEITQVYANRHGSGTGPRPGDHPPGDGGLPPADGKTLEVPRGV
jgi:membrane protein